MPALDGIARVDNAEPWMLAVERSVAKLEKVLDGQVKLETAIDALRASIDVVVRTARETKFPMPERKDPEPKERDNQDSTSDSHNIAAEVEVHIRRVSPPAGLQRAMSSSPRNRSAVTPRSAGWRHGDAELGAPALAAVSLASNAVGSNHPLAVASDSRYGSGRVVVPHPHFIHGAAMMRNDPDMVVRDWAEWTSENATRQKKCTSALMSTVKMSSTAESWRPLHPMALLPTVFDCLSMIVLVADALIIPVMVAWNLSLDGWLRYLSTFMLSFWTLDIVLKFCTGYIDGASVMRSWRMVAKRYLRRTFVFDLVLVLVDLFEIIYSLTRPDASSRGALTMTRFVRFAKLTRMARVGSRMNSGTGGVTSRLNLIIGRRIVRLCGGAFSSVLQYANLIAILMKLAFVLLGVGHLLSCAWYYMLQNAAFDGDAGEGWLGALPPLSDQEMYLYGIYWSLSTMFAGGSFLPPVLPWEITYSTLLILLGVLLVTGVTSSLAVTLIEAQQAWADAKKKLASLIRFMERVGFSGLVVMIVRENYIANITSSAKNVTEVNVQEQLETLSRDMQSLLRDLQYGASFQRVHVFRLVQVLHPRTIQELCLGACFRLIRSGDDLFEANQDMANVSLLAKGQAVYTQWLTRMQKSTMTWASDVVSDGAWLCEAALVFVWKTLGTLEARTTCETLSLSVDAFTKAVSKLPPALAVLSSFCEHFHEAGEESDSYMTMTDITIGVDTDLVVAKMPTIVRRDLVSGPLLERLRHEKSMWVGLFRSKAMSDLEKEIRVGKCYLTTTEQGDILRVVRMVVLDLRDEDGRVCVQLAQARAGQRSGNYAVNFGLPGQKCQEEETPSVVAARLLENSFAELKGKIDICASDRLPVIEYVPSKSYGIATKYIKTVIRATIRGTVVDVKSRVAKVRSIRQVLSAPPPAVVAATAASILLRAKEPRSMICVWLDEEDFSEMRARVKDVEGVLARWLSHLTAQDLEALSQWGFRASGGQASIPTSPDGSFSVMCLASQDSDDIDSIESI